MIAVPLADDEGPTGPVRASYANFLWGVAREPDSAWPSLGSLTRAGEGGRRAIIDVEKDSPAAPAGLKVGDVIVKIDDVRHRLARGDEPPDGVLQLGRRAARDHHARHRTADGDRPAPPGKVSHPINPTNLINLTNP